LDDRRRDGGTNSTLRIKEQGLRLTLNEHDDDDDDDDELKCVMAVEALNSLSLGRTAINCQVGRSFAARFF